MDERKVPAVRPARPERWLTAACEHGNTDSAFMPMRGLYTLSLQYPVPGAYTRQLFGST